MNGKPQAARSLGLIAAALAAALAATSCHDSRRFYGGAEVPSPAAADDAEPVPPVLPPGAVEPPEPLECEGPFRQLEPSLLALARILLLVDRSTSMVDPADRWTPIQEAIGEVVSTLGDKAKFGLMMYPAQVLSDPDNGIGGGCRIGGVNVAVDVATAERIVRRLDEGRPVEGNGTPTAAAVRAAGDWLQQAPTGRDYILLATDGGPGCNDKLDPNECVCLQGDACCRYQASSSCLDDAGTNAEIARLAHLGVRTLVLGITGGRVKGGEACSPSGFCGANAQCPGRAQACTDGVCRDQLARVLDDMAVSGGTDVDGRHYEVGDLADLQSQLIAAASRAIPCVYDLASLNVDPAQLEIRLDDRVIPRDPAHIDGWDARGGVVEFFGSACETNKDGEEHTIEAGCAPPPAPPNPTPPNPTPSPDPLTRPAHPTRSPDPRTRPAHPTPTPRSLSWSRTRRRPGCPRPSAAACRRPMACPGTGSSATRCWRPGRPGACSPRPDSS